MLKAKPVQGHRRFLSKIRERDRKWVQADRVPIYQCYPMMDSSQVTFFCPFCKRNHYHGWDLESDPNKPQHRTAHCDDASLENSGAHEKGYFIILVQPKYAIKTFIDGKQAYYRSSDDESGSFDGTRTPVTSSLQNATLFASLEDAAQELSTEIEYFSDLLREAEAERESDDDDEDGYCNPFDFFQDEQEAEIYVETLLSIEKRMSIVSVYPVTQYKEVPLKDKPKYRKVRPSKPNKRR